MKSKWIGCLFAGLSFSLTLAISAQQGANPVEQTGIPSSLLGDDPQVQENQLRDSGAIGPVNLIGVIPVPLPILSTDLLWVDQIRGRLYLADRTNKSVDIFDAVNNVYVESVPGFLGVVSLPTVTSQGPNGLLVTPDNKLWVGDGMASVRVVDLNLSPPRIIQSIAVGPETDGRADELAYDPLEHLIAVGFDAARPAYVAIISADTYAVLGKIQFPDATGMEQPVWDKQLHRFLVNVPSAPSYIAVIDPIKMRVTKKYREPNCSAGVNGLALGPFQRLFVYGCGRPFIMNAIDGHVIADNLTQIGTGGDELEYNPGDGRFYVTAIDTATGIQSLGVIDAETSRWIQNVPAPGLRNLAAFEGNNHIFAGVRAPAAGVADTTVCASFRVIGTGCIAVFGHF